MIDAIVCYHNHTAAQVEACLASLHEQVRQIFLVDDGSHYNPGLLELPNTTVLRRETRHGVANSFNYGAFHSNADWLLYVDPHCTFEPHAVANLMKAADADPPYRCVIGTGMDQQLDPTDPWSTALSALRYGPIPLTFLMHRTLWDQLGGIPEPPYCHMERLAAALLQRGELVATVNGVCTHHRPTPMPQLALNYWQAGVSYGALHASGVPHPYGREVERLTVDQITLYTKLLFTCAHRLAVLTGMGKVPQHPLPGVADMRFEWVFPSAPEERDG